MADVLVKKSNIHGQGVFASRDFEKDEVILKWNPRAISKEELKLLTEDEKMYVLSLNEKYFL